MRKLAAYGPSLIVLATAALVLLLGPRAVRQITFAQTQARIVQASDRLEGNSILEQMNVAYRDIAQVVEPSVVHISAERLDRAWNQAVMVGSSGSGWIYDELGYIVTNYHVIEGAERIQVQLYNGYLREAELIGADQFTDIAVLKIQPGELHPASLAPRADRVQQGDMVFAFGSPFDFRFSMSAGIVSGMGRSVGVIRDPHNRWVGYENFIQVDAAINPGNSGGPLTDVRGRVIGMNTAIATGRRSGNQLDEGQFAGIGLAIPLDMIQPVVDQLIASGQVNKGYLGVSTGELDADSARDLGFLGRGVPVSAVQPDSPAADAGILKADIITQVNGQPVGTIDQLRSLISSMQPGEIAHITLWRFDRETQTGETMEFTVPLERLDTLASTSLPPSSRRQEALRRMGLAEIVTNTDDLAKTHNTIAVSGILVLRLTPGTPAVDRIPVGSVITELADPDGSGTWHVVRSVRDFYSVLDEHDLSNGISVRISTPDGDNRIEFLAAP
jgi:serine protease Do